MPPESCMEGLCAHREVDMWWGEVGEETSEGLALTSVHRRTAPCGPGKIGMSRPVLLRTKMAPSTHTCTTHGWWPWYSLFLPSLVPAGTPDPAVPMQGTWVRGLRWEGVKAGVFSSTRRPFANIHQVMSTHGADVQGKPGFWAKRGSSMTQCHAAAGCARPALGITEGAGLFPEFICSVLCLIHCFALFSLRHHIPPDMTAFQSPFGGEFFVCLFCFFPKYCWGNITSPSPAYVLPHSGRWKTKAKRGWLTFSNCRSTGLVARRNLSANPALLTMWPLGKLPNYLVLQSTEPVKSRCFSETHDCWDNVCP